jgi:hypothetical protein
MYSRRKGMKKSRARRCYRITAEVRREAQRKAQLAKKGREAGGRKERREECL